jgi:hypothetical protein
LITLSTLQDPLVAALERMQCFPESSRPFVIVEDKHDVTMFVQFAGGAGMRLLFDVPCCDISEPCESPVDAARRGIATLAAHQVPPHAELILTEHYEAAGTS